MMGQNPYLVLGVAPTATQAEITHAYRSRLRAHHPDTRRTPCSPTADEQLQQLLAAYALLRDPTRRADYDRAAGQPPHSPPRAAPVARPSAGPVHIPIAVRHTTQPVAHPPPLWAGPVRRHR
jgi:curved DNA-binding protein CbpA